MCTQPTRRTTPDMVPADHSAPAANPSFFSQHFDFGAVGDADVMNVKAAHPLVFSHAR